MSFRSVIIAVLLIAISAACASALPEFSGTIQDGSKLAIDGAEVTLWDPSTGKGLRTSSSMGHFSLTGFTEGNYLFRVEKDGMVPAYGALHLADTPHKIEVIMLAGAVQNAVSIGAGRPSAMRFGHPERQPNRRRSNRLKSQRR